MHQHKQWVSDIFDKTASEYGLKSNSFFSYFGKRLVEQAHIPMHAKALDVATGRGAVLFPLAHAVGPAGKVVGIDISNQMVQTTSKEVREQNLDWVELKCMDAEQLDFPDHSFDFVFCGFALFFFPSIPRALAEFKRVLKPGGKLVVSIWGEDSELDILINSELKKISGTRGLMINPLSTDKELHQILEAASFKDIKIIEETKPFHHQTVEDWWKSLWSLGTRAKFEELSFNQLEELRKQVIQKAARLEGGQGLLEPLQVFYGIAKKD